MSPFEKLTGCKARNTVNNRLGLGNPDATLVTMVKGPNEQPLGTQKLDALDFVEFESVRTWRRSRNPQEMRNFINEQTEGRKRKESNFVVEINRNLKGWQSKLSDKPERVNIETKHTIKVGKRALHKKDVAEVPREIAKNCFSSKAKQ